MATNTTLSSAVAADADVFYVAANTGAVVGDFVKCDAEVAQVSAINSTAIKVKFRGSVGTKAAAHTVGATVTFCTAAELTANGPQDVPDANKWDIVSYAADGAIAVPTRNTIAYITKATAAAMTLADPAKTSNGVRLLIVTGTAAAHTVTYTAGFKRNTTSSDVATFAATANGSLDLVALDGTWVCVNCNAFATVAQVVIA